jgi:hypothetical protein
LLIYPSLIISSNLIQQFISDSSARKSNNSQSGSTIAQTPDVYYIILDGYGRQDVLQREYGFDNSEFINALQSRAFYVARRTTQSEFRC